MTNTETPLRYFGKCAVKGCEHRRVIQESSHPKLEKVTSLNGRNGNFLVVRGTADNFVWGLWFIGDKRNDQALLDAGLGCPEHGKTVIYTGGKFSHNPRKVCNARCMNATGPSCDCSCSGENHGAKWV